MNTDKIVHHLWIGRNDIGLYSDCEKLFVELSGQYNLSLVTKIFAATSINTSLESNVALFGRAYHEIENNKDFSNYLPSIRLRLEQIRAGKDLTRYHC